MYLTFVTCNNSFRIRSPPRSPSRKAVASFSRHSLMMVSGIFAPSRATTFCIPDLSRLITSALPSTIMIFFAVPTSGPAVKPSDPYFSALASLRVSETSLKISSVPGMVLRVQSWRISLALSIITLLRALRMSSIFSRVTFASQGPTLFMLSMLAAIIDVETLSRLVGISIAPFVLSFFDSNLISILPILPDFWSSRRSSSGPNKPSV